MLLALAPAEPAAPPMVTVPATLRPAAPEAAELYCVEVLPVFVTAFPTWSDAVAPERFTSEI